ncbi:MAG: glycosyltransferase family 2 protein [Erysipelotrichaceae bacterium]|nr:glycosyltransferase family 2 protein [Erysipelotrichaceae bacterium]
MKITVFTATYNRGYIIEAAYRSLRRQTVKDFEWIVIDDGSTDNTKDLFREWEKDNSNGFVLRYFYIPNGGKMRAANKAYKIAKGELFLYLDSDDYLTDDCIESIISWEQTIHDMRDSYCGVAGLRCHFDGSIIGTTFEGDYLDASTLERKKYGISGDRVEVFYTDIIQKYPFPEFEDEKFIGEGIMWNKICYCEKKILRWYNKGIYCCEYIEDGYSAHTFELSCKNPQGIAYTVRESIKMENPSFLEKMQLWHKYYLVALHNGYSSKKIKQDLGLSNAEYVSLAIGHCISRLRKKRMSS